MGYTATGCVTKITFAIHLGSIRVTRLTLKTPILLNKQVLA